jgi:hypothetical protein
LRAHVENVITSAPNPGQTVNPQPWDECPQWGVSSHSRLTVNDHCESAALAHFRGWQERCGSGFTREAGTEKRLQITYEHSGFDARPVTLGPYLRIHIPRGIVTHMDKIDGYLTASSAVKGDFRDNFIRVQLEAGLSKLNTRPKVILGSFDVDSRMKSTVQHLIQVMGSI